MKSSHEPYFFESGKLVIKDSERGIFYSDMDSHFDEGISYRKCGAILLRQYKVDDKLHGPSRAFFEDGSLSSERWFVHGILHGRAVDYNMAGTVVFKSAYRQGRFHGGYERWNDNGTVLLKGAFIDGAPEGTFVVYGTDGLVVHSTTFVQGRRDGIEFAWTEEHYALFCERWEKGERVATIIPDPLLRHI